MRQGVVNFQRQTVTGGSAAPGRAPGSLGLALIMAGMLMLGATPARAQALGPFFGIDNQVTSQSEKVRLLPEDFFSSFPTSRAENIAVEADTLVYDADRNRITAAGNVKMAYQGYLASADQAVYNRTTGDLDLIGNAVVRDPEQVVYTGDKIAVTGDFKRAFVQGLEMQTADGALITADSADYKNKVEAVLNNGSYAPCGYCIDSKGRRIGWRIRATKIVLNDAEQTLYMEMPQLELLGQPIASIPFLWMPDPTNPRAAGFRFPKFDYSQDYGARIAVPYFYPLSPTTDLWLTPMLMSRQIFMLDGEITQKFDAGTASIRAAGLYQVDRSAFTGEAGDRDWRGAIQTSGSFTPAPQWRAGWSYVAFSDPAFIPDYQLKGFDLINDIYVQHLSDNIFMDARLQEFVVSGNVLPSSQQQQARTLPLMRYDQVLELGGDNGQVAITANLLGINRQADHTGVVGGVPFTYGTAGNKVHASAQALWSRQWITPIGATITPFVGGRLDAAYYDGTSALDPVAATLFSATPIAALDMRFAFIGTDGRNTHLFEPIAQLVYRGSSSTLPGIHNDDGQGLVFEDANLFSFNRFNGRDRQETGLRLNVGGQYMANFADGSWLRLIGGQSFQLAGVNSYSVFDSAQTGAASGLDGAASFLVAGFQAAFGPGADVAGKMEFDPAARVVSRAVLAAEANISGFTLSSEYNFQIARPALGIGTNTHTLAATVGVPVADYWTVTAGANYNIEAMDWTSATLGATYDDSYLSYGATYTANHTVGSSTIDHRFSVNFNLKGLGGL